MFDIYLVRAVATLYLILSVTWLKPYLFPLFSEWIMVVFNVILLYLLYQIDVVSAFIFMTVMILGISFTSVTYIHKQKLLVSEKQKTDSDAITFVPTPPTTAVSINTPANPTSGFLLTDNGIVQGYEYASPDKFTYLS